MNIIELTELQFKNYSNIHSKKNYKQSIEYAILEQNNYNNKYLGLIDENNNVHAATLLLEKKTNSKYKYGLIPNGYLIDYNNTELLEEFTEQFKLYLKQNNYVFIRITPLIQYKKYSSNFILKENNNNIIETFKKLGYNILDDTSKLKIEINSNDINKTYQNFKRSLKRNIKECLQKGITIYQGNSDNLDDFLDFVDNKNYYKNIYNIFNNKNNKFEFYIAKMNPETYINNYRYLLKKEEINNEELNKKLKNPQVKKSNNLLTKKMTSDSLVTKYKNEIITATNIYTEYPKGVILGAIGIINNRREITFISEGYNPKFSHIKSSTLNKWEIIKKYMSLGYKKFNLGNINLTKNFKTIQGFNGNIIEYSNTFDLIINDMLYKLNNYSHKNI